jgi:thiol:disulfide interchange protein DsbD
MLAADLPPAMVQTEHLQIELVTAERNFAPGGRHWLALRLVHAPHWHTYWRNPGDSGLATRTRWTLPAGASIGVLQWPAPSRHPLGDLHNFGYDGEQYLPIELKLDPALVGESLRISVDVSWLVCEEECIPGNATLALEHPLTSSADPQAATETVHNGAIEVALSAVPQHRDWPLELRSTADSYELQLDLDAAGSEALGNAPQLFPIQIQVLANREPTLTREGSRYRWSIARSDYFVALPEPFEMVIKNPTSNLSYVLTTRSPSTRP